MADISATCTKQPGEAPVEITLSSDGSADPVGEHDTAFVTLDRSDSELRVRLAVLDHGNPDFRTEPGDEVDCGPDSSPSLDEVTRIDITDEIGYAMLVQSSLMIDLSNGPLGPGAGDNDEEFPGAGAPEIEVEFEGVVGGVNNLLVRGSGDPETFRFGALEEGFGGDIGGDLNADGDVDVRVGAHRLFVSSRSGDDRVSMRGPVEGQTGPVYIPQARLLGGSGADRLLGSPTPAACCDGSAPGPPGVFFSGGDGADLLVGTNSGNETLEGGSGNDRLADRAGDDELSGGGGIDTVTYRNATGPVEVDLGVVGESQAKSAAGKDRLGDLIENLIGSRHADTLTGNSKRNRIVSRDRRRDQVDCAGARDRVRADGKDQVTACEVVRRGRAPKRLGLIVFDADTAARGLPIYGLFAMRLDGTGLRRFEGSLLRSDQPWSTPSFSPDGGRFVASAGYGMVLVRTNGSGSRGVEGTGGRSYHPAFMPGGRRVVFVADQREPFGPGDPEVDLWSIRLDGTGLRRLTESPSILESNPDVSADGRRVVYEADGDIWSLSLRGGRLTNLTSGMEGQHFDPKVSPVGGRIAFTSVADGEERYVLMRRDGAGRRVVPLSGDETLAGFSPNARRLLFVSGDSFVVRDLSGRERFRTRLPARTEPDEYVAPAGSAAWTP